MIALVADLGRAVFVDEGFCLFCRALHRAAVFADVDAVCVLHQRPFTARNVFDMELVETLEFRRLCAVQREQRVGRIYMGAEVEVDRRKVPDVFCSGVGVDIERVARRLIPRRDRAPAAKDFALNRTGGCACAVAEIDRVARSGAIHRIAAVDIVAHGAALGGDDVTRSDAGR